MKIMTALSEKFFSDLDLPDPAIFPGVGSLAGMTSGGEVLTGPAPAEVNY